MNTQSNILLMPGGLDQYRQHVSAGWAVWVCNTHYRLLEQYFT